MTFKDFAYLLPNAECPLCTYGLYIWTPEGSTPITPNLDFISISLEKATSMKLTFAESMFDPPQVKFGFDKEEVKVHASEDTLKEFSFLETIYVECNHCQRYSYNGSIEITHEFKYPTIKLKNEFIELIMNQRNVEIRTNFPKQTSIVVVNRPSLNINLGYKPKYIGQYKYDFSFPIPMVSFIKNKPIDEDKLTDKIKKLAILV